MIDSNTIGNYDVVHVNTDNQEAVTFDEFKNFVMKAVDKCPKEWRKGQAVFNVVDEMGLARTVQFEDGVDCFYNDYFIDKFLELAYYYFNIKYNEHLN